ncbi:hypothetical protein FBUS_00644 [Fasciolopsis buskii]|uniref:Uncharacterized protein n=1 Tax=Fasciolopsis buskii TaxID=27845 RepID=A0A8E0VJI2_9TREM|nr:hypothetical protein FBUS_00644 [Fasciolopsis buski]
MQMNGRIQLFPRYNFFFHFEGKLPPTPAPCLPQALRNAAQCRTVELSTVIRLLPQDPYAFLFGIFLGQLLQICQTVDRLLQCDSIHLVTDCQRPTNWTSKKWNTSVRPVIDLCQDPHLYEKYTVILNCVKANDDRFRRCYDYPPSTSGCNNIDNILSCVKRQWHMSCQTTPSDHLIPALVNAGLWQQWVSCGAENGTQSKSRDPMTADHVIYLP